VTTAQSSPIVVRRAEARDADAIAATFQMPAAMAGTLQLPYPTAATYAKWIDDVAPGDYLLVAEFEGRVVGNLGLHAAGKSLHMMARITAGPGCTAASNMPDNS